MKRAMSQDELVDLADIPHHTGQECGTTRRAFCLGASAGLIAGAGLIPSGEGPDMAHGSSTATGGTTTGGTTTGGTTTGGTTTGGTTTGGTTTGGTTTGGTTGGVPSCPSGMISGGAASAVVQGKA